MKLNKIITKETTKEKIIITTFNIEEEALYSIKWLTREFNISKQKLFELILKDEIMHNLMKNAKTIRVFNKDSVIKTIKQRVSKSNLEKLSENCNTKAISRDEFISSILIAMYNNISSTYNEDINKTKKLIEKFKKFHNQSKSIYNFIYKNNHLRNTYSSKIEEIDNNIKKILNLLDDEVYNYKIQNKEKH